MRNLFFVLLIGSFPAYAQQQVPRFENDTMYTTTGYRIYQGQVLQFGNTVLNTRRYKYLNIKADVPYGQLAGKPFTVKRLSDFGVSMFNNAYIEVLALFTMRDGSRNGSPIHIAIDSAIRFGELIVPESDRYMGDPLSMHQYRNLPRLENDTLYTLYGMLLYPGKQAQFGPGNKKSFRHISVVEGPASSSLPNTRFTIRSLQRFGVNELNTARVEMLITVVYKDGSTGNARIRAFFDEALRNGELIIPDE